MKKEILCLALLAGVAGMASAKTPEQVLPDGKDNFVSNGVSIRKGTIAALIKNVMFLNNSLKQQGSSEQALAAINDIRHSVPSLSAVDVFNAFQLDDWLFSMDRPGSIMTGVLYLQQYPEHLTPDVKKRLAGFAEKAHPLLKTEIAKLI